LIKNLLNIKKLSIISSLIASFVFIGCGGSNINISDYTTKVSQPNIVPEVRKREYESLKELPRVAVVQFTNNSAFGKANIATSNKNEDYSHAGAAGIAVGANGAGIAEADESTLLVLFSSKESRIFLWSW
jgi:hypothetical protein